MLSIFREFDINGDMRLHKHELKRALINCGVYNISDRTLHAFFQRFDADQSGDISYREFNDVFSAFIEKQKCTQTSDPSMFPLCEKVRDHLTRMKTSLSEVFRAEEAYGKMNHMGDLKFN